MRCCGGLLPWCVYALIWLRVGVMIVVACVGGVMLRVVVMLLCCCVAVCL